MRIDQLTLDVLNAGREPVKPKPNKYHAVKEMSGGKTYDSGREAERGRELEAQQMCGIISDLKEQPKKFMLQEGFRHKSWPIKIQAITYTPDFSYIKDGKLIYEDSKGVRTPGYVLRRKMLLKRYPDINFLET